MKYRINRRTGDKISEIGMGTAYIVEAEKNDAIRTVRYAFENGINYFDLAAGDGTAFSTFGEALADVRDQVMYQIHFGSDYSAVSYGWSLDLDTDVHAFDIFSEKSYSIEAKVKFYQRFDKALDTCLRV